MISSIANLVFQLPHELPNDLGPTILENKEILRNFQIWVKTELSVPSPVQKLNFGNNSQKSRRK